jgi:hypothetical protein
MPPALDPDRLAEEREITAGESLDFAIAQIEVLDGKIKAGRASRLYSGHEGGMLAASYGPDGHARADRTVWLWHEFASEHALIEAARASLPCQLTDAERARFHLTPRGL